MGKRGPAATPLNDLLFWEHEWWVIFRGLRGFMPSAQIALGRRRFRELLQDELAELKKLSMVTGQAGIGREFQEMRKQAIENDLRPKPVLSEPEVWRALVAARNGKEVREACRKSKRWLNPDWSPRGGHVQQLLDNANAFAKAKKYAYYPKRESGDANRVLFFARAMAGIACGISPITAVDRLRKLKHGPKCSCEECEVKYWDRLEFAFYKRLSRSRTRIGGNDNETTPRFQGGPRLGSNRP